ncbi:MAG: transposase [Steroidobacteraceae bacterium]
MKPRFSIPTIPEAERTPLVTMLLGLIEQLAERVQKQEEEIAHLKDEVRVLKGQKKRPHFKPSKMDEETDKRQSDADRSEEDARRAGSDKRGKTAELLIHDEQIIQPSRRIPKGSRFKGYRDVVIQDLLIRAHNTRYRLARWLTPRGEYVTGELPAHLAEHHFGVTLRSYLLYQHHHCQVTQALLREQLREWGIDISSGAIDALLSTDQDGFHAEKDALLKSALATASYVTVDDSGARHRGKNGYVTQIGNADFAWFQSTESKDRMNFLQLLCAGEIGYRINAAALGYMYEQGLPQAALQALQINSRQHFRHALAWIEHLSCVHIDLERHQRIATEGALLGELTERGLQQRLAIVSDDAGQFKVLRHGLCWIHAERLIHTLLPLNEDQREDIAKVRAELWALYADLKDYKRKPRHKTKLLLQRRFDALFTQKTRYQTLNQLLRRLHQNKEELLLVLERPDIPLHTNGSERDIRDYVKKRKVSGGTRSDVGRRCRDTFISLKKTCRKLGVSFWDYLNDRIAQADRIPFLPDIIQTRAAPA